MYMKIVKKIGILFFVSMISFFSLSLLTSNIQTPFLNGIEVIFLNIVIVVSMFISIAIFIDFITILKNEK